MDNELFEYDEEKYGSLEFWKQKVEQARKNCERMRELALEQGTDISDEDL